MPTVKKSLPEKAKPKTKITSPFKDQALLEKEIQEFANKYKTTVVNQSDRISDYFEMSCFNYIVRFYELKDYTLTVEGLQNGQYRYKCSTSGIQSNFSFFKATINHTQKIFEFEIQHNLAVQSSFDKEIFTMPDITIIKAGKVKTTKDYYDSNKTFSFVNNTDLISFCEVKNYTPFPELIFNFIGVVNELKKNIISRKLKPISLSHIAPSLMISGKPNKQTLKIKASLEKRYCINIIYDLFYSGAETFSRNNLSKFRILGAI